MQNGLRWEMGSRDAKLGAGEVQEDDTLAQKHNRTDLTAPNEVNKLGEHESPVDSGTLDEKREPNQDRPRSRGGLPRCRQTGCVS